MKRILPTGRIASRTNFDADSFSVKSAWRRLKKWSLANLPQNDGEDQPPASATDLKEFEKAVGAKLPKDVRESYKVFNGQCAGPGIIFGLAVVPLEESLLHWRNWIKGREYSIKRGGPSDLDSRCSSFPHNYVRATYFDTGWIPVTYDGSGNHIAIDLSPGPEGTSGQVIVFGRDDEDHTVLAQSWGQFLTDLADELEAGNFRLGLTDPDYPEFDVDDPHRSHFHGVGIFWSRAKLGMKTLSSADKKLWQKRGGK